MLQLDEMSLYAAGLALLEQNLHTLDAMGLFEDQVGIQVYKPVNAPGCLFTMFMMTSEPGAHHDGDSGPSRVAIQAARPLDGPQLPNQLQLRAGRAPAER